MSISEKQKQQVIKNFSLLCEVFLPNPEIRKDIKIVFRDQKLEGETLFQFHDRKLEVSFWDQDYKSLDFLCEVVSHEFTHVLFFLAVGEHSHSSVFWNYASVLHLWLLKNKVN